MPQAPKKAYPLRIEPASVGALERCAAADFRSVNAQIEVLLREALGRRGVKVAQPEQRKRGRPKKEDEHEPKSDEDAWFAPKRYGYGAGLPIAWQGWAILIGYIALIAAAAALVRYSWIAFAALVAAATAALIVTCAQKTRGGFRWRWGGKD